MPCLPPCLFSELDRKLFVFSRRVTMTKWLLLAVALFALALVMLKTTERFEPEFLDKSQVKKTVAVENSSYAQVTNHADPHRYSMGPIQGTETPFRVNQYTSFIV